MLVTERVTKEANLVCFHTIKRVAEYKAEAGDEQWTEIYFSDGKSIVIEEKFSDVISMIRQSCLRK